MRNKTILYPPTIDWLFLKQRPQHLLTQFARNGYQVLYCNKTQIKNKKPEKIMDNLYVYHDFSALLDSIIKYKSIKVDILFSTWAKSYIYVDIIPSKIVIYDSLDSFSEWSSYEKFMINKADIITTTSEFLYNLRSKDHPYVHLVRNACDSSFIDSDYTIPDEIKNINGPKIGFVGAIGKWVSTSIMKKVADKYPNTFFIGREFGKSCPANVINLGVKSHDDLKNYYYGLDVCLLPFITKQEVTQAANPIKQYEHMSCGKPTVATSWRETELYPDVILTSNDPDQFLNKIEDAIRLSKNKAFINRCFEIARENTWERRFEQLDGIIKDYCKTKGIIL